MKVRNNSQKSGTRAVPVLRIRRTRTPAPLGRASFQVLGEAWLSSLALADGDLLCVGGAAGPGDLCVLVPRTWGHPMLGRRTRNGLVAEPSGLPASRQRWEVAGKVLGILRGEAWYRSPAGGHWGGRSGNELVAPARGGAHGSTQAPLHLWLRVPDPELALVRRNEPSLWGRPVVVAEPGPGGTTLRVSPEARAMGFSPGIPADQLLAREPRVHLRQLDPEAVIRFAETLASAMGPGARSSLDHQSGELVVSGLVPPRYEPVLRRLLGWARVPVAVGLGPEPSSARDAASRVSPGQVLQVLGPGTLPPPGAGWAELASLPAARRTRPGSPPAGERGLSGEQPAQLQLFQDLRAA